MNQERLQQLADEAVIEARKLAQGWNSGRIQGSPDDRRTFDRLYKGLADLRVQLYTFDREEVTHGDLP